MAACYNVAITRRGYPAELISINDVMLIKAFLLREIDAMEGDEQGPVFVQFKRSDGAMMVSCINAASAAWLIGSMARYNVDGIAMECKPLEELERPPTLRMWVGDADASFEQAKGRLQKQNVDINTASWKELYGLKKPNGTLFTFQADAETALKVGRDGLRLNFGLADKVLIKKPKGLNSELGPENGPADRDDDVQT